MTRTEQPPMSDPVPYLLLGEAMPVFNQSELDRDLAWLIVGTINEHFPNPLDESDDDPVMGSSGCVIQCGPCGAMHRLSQTDQGRKAVEAAVRITGYEGGGWDYWDDETDGLRWDWFADFWARHKGCSVSNGIVGPCQYNDEGA